MTVEASSEITRLLAEARAGDADAWNRAVEVVYDDLRRIARGRLPRTGRDQTLDTTGLVHECFLRIARGGTPPVSRAHFLSLAARVMRQVVVDYARERIALKRGGDALRVPLEAVTDEEFEQARQFVALEDALAALSAEHPQQARIVECRFFGGMTEPETAAALELSLRVVQREWHAARHWLARFLDE